MIGMVSIEENNNSRLMISALAFDVVHSCQASTPIPRPGLVNYRSTCCCSYGGSLVGTGIIADNNFSYPVLWYICQHQTNRCFFVVSRNNDVDDRFLQCYCFIKKKSRITLATCFLADFNALIKS